MNSTRMIVKRAAMAAILVVISAIAACGVAPSIYIDEIPGPGASCSAGNGEPACSADSCGEIGACCETDALGGCVLVCEPCCDLGDAGIYGAQGYQCVTPTHPADAGPPALTCGAEVPICPMFNLDCVTAADCCPGDPDACAGFACQDCCIEGTSHGTPVCVSLH